MEGMRDEGNPYKGVLFIGLMITKTGPKVLEFNCRLGDPETQVILPLLETDLVAIIQSCIEGNLETQNVLWQDKAAACVVMASGGYPGQYETGFIIKGLEDIEPSTQQKSIMLEQKLILLGEQSQMEVGSYQYLHWLTPLKKPEIKYMKILIE